MLYLGRRNSHSEDTAAHALYQEGQDTRARGVRTVELPSHRYGRRVRLRA